MNTRRSGMCQLTPHTCSQVPVLILIFLDSLAGTRLESRSVTPQAPTLRATVNILLIASVLFTTCLTKRSTVPSRCATAMLWIFLVYTLQAGKPFPTLSPPSLSARLHRYLILPVSPPARIVKHIRVLRFSPTLPRSPPLRPLPLRQAPEQAKIVVPVRAVLHLHLLPDLTVPELLRYHSSRPSLALHFLLHSLPRCLCSVMISCKIGRFWGGTHDVWRNWTLLRIRNQLAIPFIHFFQA